MKWQGVGVEMREVLGLILQRTKNCGLSKKEKGNKTDLEVKHQVWFKII